MVPMSALASPTAATTLTATATPITNGTDHDTTKIGVGVGVGVGVPLLAALIGLWTLLIKEKRKTKLLQANRVEGFPEGHLYRNSESGHDVGPQRQELPALSTATELPERFSHAELR